MRIVLVGIVSLAAALSSFGQGTVNFVNNTAVGDPLRLTTPPDRLVRWGSAAQHVNAAFISGNGVFSNNVVGLRAQLYQGNSAATEGTLTAATSSPVTFKQSSSPNVGTWVNKTGVELANIAPTNTGKLQVRVWDTTYAPTYDAAEAIGVAYPGILGKSALFNYTPPDTNGTALPTDYGMTNFASFNVGAPQFEGPAAIATNPPSISQQVGTTANLPGRGAGEPTLTYQWYRSPATLLSGKTTATLTLNNIQLADAGSYYFVVGSPFGGGTFATSSVGVLTVTCPDITLSPASPLTAATSGSAYSENIVASGGTGPYSYAQTGGSLAGSGLSLSSGGVLSGTATTAGTYNFTVTATDSYLCTGSSNYSITVNCVGLSLGALGNASGGNAYSNSAAASGGTAPYTYEAGTNCPNLDTNNIAGLPPGLTLNTNSGAVTGVPTVLGCYEFSVTATDANNCVISQCYTVCVTCATITLNPPTLPNGNNTVGYTQTVAAVGGLAPHTYAVTSGSLPTGLTLNTNTGVIDGVPTGAAPINNFTITATDSLGCTGAQAYSITVGAGPDGTPAVFALKYPKATKTTDKIAPGNTISCWIQAADASGISQSLARVNGGSWTSGTITPVGSKFYCTNTVTLITGTNLVEVTVVDGSGQGTTNQYAYVFLGVAGTLTVNNPDGTHEIDSKPPGAPTTFYVGRTYQIKKLAPGANNVFSNILSSGSASGNTILYTAASVKENQKGAKKIPFLMETNLTLTIQCPHNRFIEAGGVYYGLFSEGTTAHESSGWFTVKTDSKQKFSGKLMQQGELVSFGGTFDLTGLGTPKPGKPIARKVTLAGADVLTLGLQLDLVGSMSLSGSVLSTNWGGAATMDADKSFDGNKVAIPPVLSAQGAFALVMAGGTNAAAEPAGDGYVFGDHDSAKNVLKTKGYAGDGEKIKKTLISGLSTNGDWPFYTPLYIDPVNSKLAHGAIIGWLNISNGVVTGDLIWTKKSTAPGPAPYSGGFTNVKSDSDGSLVSSTAPAVPGGILASGTVTIQDGNLGSPITDTFTFDAVSKFLCPGVLTNGIKLKVKPTGELSGAFDPVNKYKVYGIALQGSLRGVFTTGGTQSGSVRLTP